MRITIGQYHSGAQVLDYRAQDSIQGPLTATFSWSPGVTFSTTIERIEEALHRLEAGKPEEFIKLPSKDFRLLIMLIADLQAKMPGCHWADMAGYVYETSPDGATAVIKPPAGKVMPVEPTVASTGLVEPPTAPSSPPTEVVCFFQERIGRYHYSIWAEHGGWSFCVQDLMRPADVPESEWEGILIAEGACEFEGDCIAEVERLIYEEMREDLNQGLEKLNAYANR